MIILEIKEKIAWITLNRVDKHNAFNEELLHALGQSIAQAIADKQVRVLILAAKGRFFSAGADLHAMQRAATLAAADNVAQAQQLADILSSWHQSPKPTISLVQGPAYGGALGFIAASDLVIASPHAKFCFSEAKLGLIPAVISPYVLQVLGYKACKRLFLSAETFAVQQAQDLGLVDHISEQLEQEAASQAQVWINHPQTTLATLKSWLHEIYLQDIDATLIQKTAEKLAEVRMHADAQQRLNAFLNGA